MKKLNTILVCCALFLTVDSFAQNEFIVEWTFPTDASSVSFGAQTAGAVAYTWTTTSGNSGSGSFNQSSADLVTLSGLTITAGDKLTVSFAPANLRRFYQVYGFNNDLLTDIKQWGSVPWSSMFTAFYYCTNLTGFSATDAPDLSAVQTMGFMFSSANLFNGDLSGWDVSNVTDMQNMFFLATSFNGDLSGWDVGNVGIMSVMFYNATSFNGDLSGWDIGKVVLMTDMFHGATSFNGDLSGWDVGNVKHMSHMFEGATSFNQNLGNWNLNPAVSLSNMFDDSGMDCGNYSATLIGWQQNNPTVTGRSLGASGRQYGTNAVTARNTLINNQGWTISGDSPSGTDCNAFAQNEFIAEWTFPSGTNQVKFGALTAGTVDYTWTTTSGNSGSFTQSPAGLVTLSGLTVPAGDKLVVSFVPANLRRFYQAYGSNNDLLTDIKQWGSVPWSSMESAFVNCTNLNGFSAADAPDLSAVTNMVYMFYSATSFNSDLSGWDVSKVTDMSAMFEYAALFNGDLSSWDVSKVTDMTWMFRGAVSFNSDLSGWDVGNVVQMYEMFAGATSFNSDLSGWNVSNVTSMFGMFFYATSFNQNLADWHFKPSVDLYDMLTSSGMDCGNYSATLIGWQQNNPAVTGRHLGASGRQYGTNAVAARTALINNQGWTIFGDSPSGTVCSVGCNVTVDVSPTHTSCGLANGSATANPTGGSGYTYSWSDGQATQTIDNLSAGTYSVTVTDTDGCTATASTTINGSDGISTTISTTHTSCGLANGSATATPTGGSGYTYSWSDGQTTQTISNLSAETYSVTVTDTDGCTATASTTINGSAGISTTISTTHTSCGLANGSATATPTGGSGYTYSWSDGQTTQTIDNLSAGTYIVTVTDTDGCTATASTTINGSAGISTTISTTHTSCGLANGSATATPTGGSGYTYSWSDGQTTQTISNLSAETYSVTVTDTDGCTATASTTINGSAGISTTISTTHTSCGLANGSATAIPTGGSGYTYSWSDGQTTQTIDNVSAGTYGVTVTDTDGCTATASTTVNSSNGITISVSSTDESCNSCKDGTATVVPTGATTYSYLWSNGATDQSLTGLSPDTYEVTVTGDNGCTATATVEVNQFGCEAIQLEATVTHPLCHGETGTAVITATGGNEPYTYLWSNGEATSTVSVPAGTYTVVVSDQINCSATVTVTVAEPGQLSALTASTGEACFETADGTATVVPMGGTAPHAYLWSNGSVDSLLTGLVPGVYTVTVTDANGCSASASATVAAAEELHLSVDGDAFICFGGEGILNATAGFTNYLWSTGDTISMVTWNVPGTYSVTVSDINNCSTTVSIDVTVNPELVSQITENKDTLTVQVSGGTAPYTYLWSTGDMSVSIAPAAAGTYKVTVTDVMKCIVIDSVDYTVSTHNLQAVAPIKIHPNPATDFVYFDVPNGIEAGIISLYDSDGKLALRQKAGSATTAMMDISGLVPGTYVLRIVNKSTVYAAKVVKH